MNAAIVVIEIVVMAVIGTISFLLLFSEDNIDDLATTSSGGGVVIRSGVTLFDLFDDVFFAMLASAGSILTTPKDAALDTAAINDNKQRSRFIVADGYEMIGKIVLGSADGSYLDISRSFDFELFFDTRNRI